MNDLLEKLDITLDDIADKNIRQAFTLLFNLVEELSAENRTLKQENQQLKDEINRLKGEQGKPAIKGNKPDSSSSTTGRNISSESERKKRGKKPGKKGSKKDKLRIDKSEVCRVNKSLLPADAVFKGYQTVVSQDIEIRSVNTEFKKEVYYSPSQRKTYIGILPPGYEGDFGPGLKTLVIVMSFVSNMTQPKILRFLENFGVAISAGSLSNLLIKDQDEFHREKDEFYEAGLESTRYQQTDDTSARVNGKNYYSHIVCNRLYSVFFTRKRKDRLTVLDVLRNLRARRYVFDEDTYHLLKHFNLSAKLIKKLKQQMPYTQELNQEEVNFLLATLFPKLGKNQKARLLESAAISAYQKEIGYRVVKLLLCDDAPQFKQLTEELALCWVHDGRHYKKLSPVIPYHIIMLKIFLDKYWAYYRKLLAYKENPCKEMAESLSLEFDKIFSIVTGYNALDERIAKTREKKAELLMVLKYPELPLHNNESELAARVKVRKRDISMQTRTEEGTQASDTFLSIAETCRKLGVNVYDYIFDRLSKKFHLPSLAEMIRLRAALIACH